MRREDRVTHHLAGGSLLAAQWGHRESSDVDMILKGVDMEEAARIVKTSEPRPTEDSVS